MRSRVEGRPGVSSASAHPFVSSNSSRRTSGLRLLLIASSSLAVLTVAGSVASAQSVATTSGDPARGREIVLVARNMAFYLDGNPTPNPTLRVKAGERVHIVLRSDDAGFTHDFAVKAWNAATDFLTGKGAVSVTVTVPDTPGARQEYVCSAHAVMMRGMVEVE